MQDVLTPLVAHQHRTRCVSGAVVSFPAGEQVVPEHCWTLEDTHRQEAAAIHKDLFYLEKQKHKDAHTHTNTEQCQSYLHGPNCCTDVWKHCGATCCYITHLQQGRGGKQCSEWLQIIRFIRHSLYKDGVQLRICNIAYLTYRDDISYVAWYITKDINYKELLGGSERGTLAAAQHSVRRCRVSRWWIRKTRTNDK